MLDYESSPPPASSTLARRLRRTAWVLLWIVIGLAAVFPGLAVRDWCWQATAPIRFRYDIGNAVRIGNSVALDAVLQKAAARVRPELPDRYAVWRAYLGQYDKAQASAEARRQRRGQTAVADRDYGIDYPPGRLFVMTAWAQHEIEKNRRMSSRYSDDMASPLLWFNTAHELVASVGVFALARRVLRDAGRSAVRAEALAMVAALLGWFSPAVILNAHGWPQWDAWVLPYTIWAVYCAVADRWLLAGALLAVGAMFKGQVLMFAPLLALWPLLRLNVDALARLGAGFLAAAGVVLIPWLLRPESAQVWTMGTVVLAGAHCFWPRRGLFGRAWWLAAAALAGWVLSPWSLLGPHPWHVAYLAPIALALMPLESMVRGQRDGWRHALRAWWVMRLILVTWLAALAPGWCHEALRSGWPLVFGGATAAATRGGAGLWAAIALVLAAILLPSEWRGRRVAWLTTFVAATIFLAAVRFDGSFACIEVGFQTGRYPSLFLGRVANVPAILQVSFGLQASTLLSLPFVGETPLRSLLQWVAYSGVLIAAVAVARSHKRHTPGLLVGVVATWALLYAFLPQMHERYLTWAAFTSALLAARSVGGVLIYLAFNAIQCAMLLYAMIGSASGRIDLSEWATWYQVGSGLQPDVGYVVATLAVVLLVWSFARGERGSAGSAALRVRRRWRWRRPTTTSVD